MGAEWISAAEALELVEAVAGSQAARVICSRAHAGIIVAKAVHFIKDEIAVADALLPKYFWWAEGEASLEQNWRAGDFATWIDKRYHWKAFGVSFLRRDVEQLVGSSRAPHGISRQVHNSGRPPAAWWDELWIEICRQLYDGTLIPKKQADIETAMLMWLSSQDVHPTETTIRVRARKLWAALRKGDDKN